MKVFDKVKSVLFSNNHILVEVDEAVSLFQI